MNIFNHQNRIVDFRLRISTSIYSVPSICNQDQIADWFDSLAGCLHWNVRKQQKEFIRNTQSTDSMEGYATSESNGTPERNDENGVIDADP